jgi:hypothetical protein
MKTNFRKITPRGMVISFMIFQWFFFLPAYVIKPEVGSFPPGPRTIEIIKANSIKPLPNYQKAFIEAVRKDDEGRQRKQSFKLILIVMINILIDVGLIFSYWNSKRRKQTEQGRCTIPTGALR